MKNNKMKNKNIVFWIVMIVAFLFGLIGVYHRISEGLIVTNMTSHVTWGLWIAQDIYFIGLSAGAFLLSSLAFVFGIERFEKIGKLALVTAILTLLCALSSAWFDIGHMERFYKVFTSPNFGSLLTVIVWLYSFYFVLLCIELFLATQEDLVKLAKAKGKIYKYLSFGKTEISEEKVKSNRRKLKIVASLGIPLAIAFHGGFGAVFAVVAANPFWHTAIYPIYFLIGALVSGAALVTVLVAFFMHDKTSEEFKSIIAGLGKITLALLLFDTLLEFSEITIAYWGRLPEHIAGFNHLLFGQYWWVFWIVHLLLGVTIPVILLSSKPSRKKYGWAGILISGTFMAVRLNIVIPGLTFEKVKGLSTAFIQKRLLYQYFPSLDEFLVGLFILSIAISLFIIAKKILPITKSVENFIQEK